MWELYDVVNFLQTSKNIVVTRPVSVGIIKPTQYICNIPSNVITLKEPKGKTVQYRQFTLVQSKIRID